MVSATHKILLTGFEPFAEFEINSSWQAVQELARERTSKFICECLPVDYHAARDQLIHLLDKHQPNICLCTGLAAGDTFRLEQQARKPSQFSNLKGADSYPGQWPWDETLQSFQAKGLPAYISEDAGQYVCESTYWILLGFRDQHGYPEKAAFLHVPPLSEDWPLDKIAGGLKAMLGAFIQE